MQLITTAHNGLSSVNLEALAVRYMEYLDVSKATFETYAKALKHFIAYLTDKDIKAPVRADVVAFRDELKAQGLAPATVQLYIVAVRLFFQWLEQEGFYSNIAQHVKGAKVSREHKKDYLTAQQVKGILTSLPREKKNDKRDYAIFLVMVACGLRTVEITRLDVSDLTTRGGQSVLMVQGKGKDEKTAINCPAMVEQAIREYLAVSAHEGALFASQKGGRLTTRSIRRTIKNILQANGYTSDRLTAHSLRHTAVTLALLAGEELAEVQAFARHASINTTMIYNHAIEQERNTCASSILQAIA